MITFVLLVFMKKQLFLTFSNKPSFPLNSHHPFLTRDRASLPALTLEGHNKAFFKDYCPLDALTMRPDRRSLEG